MQDLMERSKNYKDNVDIERVADFLMCFTLTSVYNTSTSLVKCLFGIYVICIIFLFNHLKTTSLN
jgi:hypothetical protein